MEADKEIWKDVEGYEGLYKVSSYGNVLSLKYCGSNRKHLLAQNPDHKGYLMVYLSKRGKRKTFKVHRLVASAFIPNPNNLPQVNHKDGVRNNNSVDNLEWCDEFQNAQHAINILGKTMKGKTNSKPVYCKELDKSFKSMKQAVEFLGNHACNEGIKKAILANRHYHGYTFSFIERSTTIENTTDEVGSE